MNENPYLCENRLQDVVAALQLLGTYRKYDLNEESFRKLIASNPRSATSWSVIFREHLEFFRQSETEGDFCLVLRRAKRNDEKRHEIVPELTSSELSMLIDTAIHLQEHALELKKERRAWIPLWLTGAGIMAALAGAIIGAIIKG